MRHKSNNKTRPLFTLSLEMTRLVNETRLLLVPCFNSDIYSMLFKINIEAARKTNENKIVRRMNKIDMKPTVT